MPASTRFPVHQGLRAFRRDNDVQFVDEEDDVPARPRPPKAPISVALIGRHIGSGDQRALSSAEACCFEAFQHIALDDAQRQPSAITVFDAGSPIGTELFFVQHDGAWIIAANFFVAAVRRIASFSIAATSVAVAGSGFEAS